MRHDAPISGIATHPSGYVATAGYDNRVILWNAEGEPMARGWHDHLANQCTFNHDGTLLASASSDYSARIWSVPSMRLVALLRGHQDDVEMVAFSPDGAAVATCSRDRTVRVHGIDGSELALLEGHAADVISVVWSPDGRDLISSSDDGTVRRWDVASSRQVAQMDTGGIETDTLCVARSGAIFAGDDEGRLSILTGNDVQRVQAHLAGVKRVVWDESSRQLLSLSYDRTVRLWRYVDGTLEPHAEGHLPSEVWPRSAAFRSDDTVVFATFGSSFATWMPASNQWDVSNVGPTGGINAVLELPDGLHTIGDAGLWKVDGAITGSMGSLCNFLVEFDGSLLTGGQMGALFEARTGQAIVRHRSPLNCATTFMRRGQLHAVIGTYTGEGLVVARSADGVIGVVASIRMHANAIKDVACDGRTIFSVCADASVAWHDVDTLEPLNHIAQAHDRIANGCCMIEEGNFASIGRDLTLRLWTPEGMERLETPHRHSIKCVAASAGGATIATGGYDGTVAIFDTLTRSWVGTCRASSGGLSSLTPGLDGEGFFASGYDGYVYRIAAGPVVRAERVP
ncbi:WD40 repeat domain-containing protein [Pinirhizobacter soli]|uniref:WD40 repeat domain-containing protein n=1 Tax=Pinirhizobacter soli TaxID=2786953 RepID=UPI002029B4DB|nr:WD40 repeat domain-containing protein [Pinirhizobacter soli]